MGIMASRAKDKYALKCSYPSRKIGHPEAPQLQQDSEIVDTTGNNETRDKSTLEFEENVDSKQSCEDRKFTDEQSGTTDEDKIRKEPEQSSLLDTHNVEAASIKSLKEPTELPKGSRKSKKKSSSKKDKNKSATSVSENPQAFTKSVTSPDAQATESESPINISLPHLPLEVDATRIQDDTLDSSQDIVSILAIKGKTKGKKVGSPLPVPVDINNIIERLLAYKTDKLSKHYKIKNSEIFAVCARAREILMQQPVLLELNPPVRIVGDIHGQFKDLLRFFDMCGYPPSGNYLFLGDYVDRGKQSLETILLLLCFKIKYPENLFMLRGNHECASVNRVYGFYDECKRKCNLKVWRAFTDLFNCLPVTAIVGGKIFCVHGGLSPGLSSMDDILKIQRPMNVPDFGLLNDLLWSDPSETAVTWEGNERGVSYCFSKQILTSFLDKHGFDLVCRAHMVVEDGYEFFNSRTLVTIFSAPNYCGEFDNRGAIMNVSEELLCSFEILEPEFNHSIAIQRLRKPLKKVTVTRRAAFP